MAQVGCISLFARIFGHAKLPLRLRPYRIVATSPSTGFIEVVPNAKSLDSVKKSRCETAALLSPFSLFSRSCETAALPSPLFTPL